MLKKASSTVPIAYYSRTAASASSCTPSGSGCAGSSSPASHAYESAKKPGNWWKEPLSNQSGSLPAAPSQTPPGRRSRGGTSPCAAGGASYLISSLASIKRITGGLEPWQSSGFSMRSTPRKSLVLSGVLRDSARSDSAASAIVSHLKQKN
eukprot:2895149-Rhodomonas_salina.2